MSAENNTISAESKRMAEYIRQRIALTDELAPDTVGSMLRFELLECDAGAGEYLLRCSTAQWMRNVFGSLHGGISALVADHAMGIVANSVRAEQGLGPTVQLQLTYHHPLAAGEDVLIKVQVLSVTRTLTHLTARAYAASEPQKLCASATGTYFFKISS